MADVSDLHITKMIRETMLPLNQILPAIAPLAARRTIDAMDTLGAGQMDPRRYPKIYADMLLASMRSDIESSGLEGWRLKKQTNCLHLVSKDTGLYVRMLKESRQAPPSAGHNRARRIAWAQPGLIQQDELLLEGTSQSLSHVRMIIAWVEDKGDFQFTAYHTIGTGKYPYGAPTDLAFSIGIEEDEYLHSSFTSTQDEEIIIPKKNLIITEPSTSTSISNE